MINALKLFISLTFISSVFILVACSKAPEVQKITLSLQHNGEVVQCKKPIIIANNPWRLEQFLFYIHDAQYQDSQGNWQKLVLSSNAYQHENIVLLGGTCESEQLSNWQIELADSVPIDQLVTLRFNMGIPFEKNHLNPLGQPSPMSLPSMFWVWRSGHKFMRLELSAPDDFWLFHLGSTGCNSQSAVRSPTSVCINPNVFSVNIPLDVPLDSPLGIKSNQLSNNNRLQTSLSVDIALDKIVGSIDIGSETQCQSEPDNLACQQLFNNLNKKNVFEIGKHNHDK